MDNIEPQSSLEVRRAELGDAFFIHPNLEKYYADKDARDWSGRRYFDPNSSSEISEFDRIQAKLQAPDADKFIRDRKDMQQNFKMLIRLLDSQAIKDQFPSFPQRLKYVVILTKLGQVQRMKQVKRESPDKYSDDEITFEEGLHQRMLDSFQVGKPERLMDHLQEGTKALTDIFDDLRERKKLPLTERQVALMQTLVAPLHDIMKFLGSMQQIDPDHENILEYVLENYAEGQKVEGLEGTLSKEDVEFVKIVASSHEDIYRMNWFESLVQSFDQPHDEKTPVNDPYSIDRAISLFHIVDIFGSACSINDEGNFEIKTDEEFDNRFLNLFKRHIKMHIKGTDWNEGKAFLPEWGAYAIRSVIYTAQKIAPLKEGMIEVIKSKMVGVLNEAITAIDNDENKANFETEKNRILATIKLIDDIKENKSEERPVH